MYLALDTGMRMQEILNLKWSDIDFEQRRIEIRKSKTDRKQVAKGGRAGRRIVLPYMAMSSLIDLAQAWRFLV
jgi:integrase